MGLLENSNRNPRQIRSKFSFFLTTKVKTSAFMRPNIRYIFFFFLTFFFSVSCSSDEETIWNARDSLSRGNTAEAMRLYESILKKNPTHLEANRTLGMILADSGLALNSAAFYLEKAESSLPGDSSLLLYLLEIHLQEKDRDKTKRILEKISKSKDKEIESYAIFLKDCLLEKKKNGSEFNRFKTSTIPTLLPPARRLFLKCELSLYGVSHNSDPIHPKKQTGHLPSKFPKLNLLPLFESSVKTLQHQPHRVFSRAS
ncbi:tetratricopeptide repeat protein [Leptospira borgpetersenii]|uniref:Tetratricopeptide repeat protein n=2 Tax=Leptospira borgpetersenii TaxID=174 RepID=A0A0E3B2C9_LEPBO|nr:tetratricopeptide repeat protein [Leptospira borgpetersenii]ALO25854.1 hypothetical protein LBBP_01565 [Leptospira borgpetersenii serovar Ballum]ANH00657.2 Uncharacterized protein LB4E_1268 [Leptospira borgpetersenii str. 4E]AXX16106.1 hypothetical protein C4Q31_11600 [Leptospira borgpetersenii serovar Ceylonica]EKQ90852.1 hypothetical protein LEP1GSC101_1205 [Leptospira borgpetersenii str. UI 09149]EKR00582.1 hypothetical protein LEP1GSC121_1199 [Leptospira borgpetersenii serovar Castellon